MSNIDQIIISIIIAKPGQKAKDIASQLRVDCKTVNSVLYGQLRGKVWQDKNYRWYPAKNTNIAANQDENGQPRLDTPLGKLCRYYLDCLGHDDIAGVRVFASSNYGTPDYTELETLPMFDEDGADPLETEGGKRILSQIRRDRNQKTLFLGYPVRLNKLRSKKGWEGFMVEPVLLFSFQEPETKYGKWTLTSELPIINFKALSSLTNSSDSNLMQEAFQLADDLGYSGDEQPEIDELIARMCDIRSDWDWKETIDPNSLSTGIPLAEISEEGIYNRAVIVATERSPFTKGLETELGKLQALSQSLYNNTALGTWIAGNVITSEPPDQQPLIEVLPLNSEQRQAVQQALTNPLTVITGPPGTGKSQVVTSILINAAWQGKTVLFASKNNKAVDVVEARVNSLGSRPVLLRLGSNEYQGKLAEYLTSLLSATATSDDQNQYSEFQTIHERLRHESSAIDDEFNAIISLRNEVDGLEREVEEIRRQIGSEIFKRLPNIDADKLLTYTSQLRLYIDKANHAKQPIFTRLFWFLILHSRYSDLELAIKGVNDVSVRIGLPIPSQQVNAATIDSWIEYGDRLSERASLVSVANRYFAKLKALTGARSLEDLTKVRIKLTEEIAKNSDALWKAWLRLQPAHLTQIQRKLLGDYSALLKLIVAANDENRQLGADVFRRYYQLFPQITAILPCWAVTSLSARGRIPFEPTFFDLLVIDEASQCDIASALPLLYRAKRVVVIGDPKQLSHISTLSKHQDRQLLSKHGLVDNYPGWTYSTQSLFDLASTMCRSEDIVALRDHHRSHADIIEFSNGEFYEGRLRVATRYDRLRSPDSGGPAVRWVDVKGYVKRPGSGGAVNEAEAKAVIHEIRRLISQGYQGNVGVVSPFRAQANKIKDLVYSSEGMQGKITSVDFLVDTAHKFQGDERDVIIFSPVVSSDISDGALGFLRNTPNLFNVAITRARASLIVVGDRNAALNSRVDYLARFAAYIDKLGLQQVAPDVVPFGNLGAEYPTVSQPELVSEWERIFYRTLFNTGVPMIPQYPVEKYILDFAIIKGERRLNIEIDGERYHRNWDGELCRRDQIRNQRLIEIGWDVMRFWVYQVRDDMDGCITRVKQWTEG